MIDLLYSFDLAVFHLINRTLSNPVGDVLWPLITSYDRYPVVRGVLLIVWLWLLIRGGTHGRTVALLVIPLLLLSDQIASSVLKPLVDRARPCHLAGGVPVIPDVRLLVDCGPGRSFPSSHAVNNFALATLFSYYYRRAWWGFFTWAGLVALSRVAVGVHFPSDVAGGAVIGIALGMAVIGAWNLARRYVAQRKNAPGEKGT